MTRGLTGAAYLAQPNGNGAEPRRFGDEVPSRQCWAEVVALLSAGLAAIIRSPAYSAAIWIGSHPICRAAPDPGGGDCDVDADAHRRERPLRYAMG